MLVKIPVSGMDMVKAGRFKAVKESGTAHNLAVDWLDDARVRDVPVHQVRHYLLSLRKAHACDRLDSNSNSAVSVARHSTQPATSNRRKS